VALPIVDDKSVNVGGNWGLPAENIAFITFGIAIVGTAVYRIEGVIEVYSGIDNGTVEGVRTVTPDAYAFGEQIGICAVTIGANINWACFCWRICRPGEHQCRNNGKG
jgi:hypothetical protein